MTLQTTTRLESFKRIAERPYSILDYLQLGLPYPWQVVAAFRRVPLGDLNLYGTLLSLTMPFCLVAQRAKTSRSATLQVLSIVLSSICLWKVATPVYQLLSGMKIVLNSTSTANPSAWECMAKRIEQGLLYRRRQYDIYLPPQKDQGTTFILFLPGASVEHEAYAEPVSRLADAGYTVVVVSAQVLKLVDDRLMRFRTANLRAIQREVENGVPQNWVLAGHSMGSFLCTKLATRLPNVLSVVMWGVAPFVEYMGDLSATTDIRVLVVQASNDMIVAAFATEERWEKFAALLPRTKIVHEIKGGTHSGFANYLPHWKPEVEGISAREQHQEAVDVTIGFLEGGQ